MSEKYPLLAEEEECFFLTSPFIEPDGHGNANTARLTPVFEDAARVLGKSRSSAATFLSDRIVRSKPAILIWWANSRELHFAFTASPR